MKTFGLLAACGTLILLSTTMTKPALAMDKSAAVQACNKNPNCWVEKGRAGVNINVGNNEIYCPDKGECVCLSCLPPRRPRWTDGDPVRGIITDQYYDEPSQHRDGRESPGGKKDGGGVDHGS